MAVSHLIKWPTIGREWGSARGMGPQDSGPGPALRALGPKGAKIGWGIKNKIKKDQKQIKNVKKKVGK